MDIKKINSLKNQSIATQETDFSNAEKKDTVVSSSIYDLARNEVCNSEFKPIENESSKSFFGELFSAIGNFIGKIFSFIFGNLEQECQNTADVEDSNNNINHNEIEENEDIEVESYSEDVNIPQVEEYKEDTELTQDVNDGDIEDAQRNDDAIDTMPKYNDFKGDFDMMLGYVFDFEGGYGNIPEDRGGATNYGITQGTYDYWNDRHGVERKDVINITKEEAKEIYYNDFYLASGADEYVKKGDNAYAFLLFDAAVNHGVGAAYDFDNEAKGDPDKFMEARKQFYIDIVANDPSQAIFEQGWQNRWNKVYSIINKDHEYEDYVS